MKIIADTTAMADWLQTGVPWLLGAVWIFGALLSSGHALLNKREVGAVTSWVALVWLAPLLGIGLYWVLGVNRVRRRAVKLRARWSRGEVATVGSALPEGVSGELRDELAPFVERVANRPLCTGNAIDVLVNGDETYPAMLSAIEGAKQSICLLTYIFDTDKWGLRFIEALAAAKQRGVQVKVLVDALGVRYSRPCADRLLLQRGVDAKRFLPLHKTLHFNLRNHRKLLIVDEDQAFTGGMNIREACVLNDRPRAPVRDLHFRLQGAVIDQLIEVFEEDWVFSGGTPRPSGRAFPDRASRGKAAARAISDGPDEDLDRIPWTLHGALACARERVIILTPYFLPNAALAKALNVAAMRGVQVDIVVPRHSNLPLVDWAMWAGLWRFMGHGCRLWLGSAPFDHTKMMVVDQQWVLIGSSNWDPRSLRLNFELGVEVYDRDLAARLVVHADAQINQARLVTAQMLAERPAWSRLRDGIARLLTPYL